MRRIYFLLAILLAALLIAGCNQVKPHKESRFIMDTLIDITVYGTNAQDSVREAFGEYERIYRLANLYDDNSQLAQINRAAGIKPIKADPALIEMLERACDLSAQLDGAFDVSIGPLTELWGIGKKGEFVPSDDEIKEALALVDYRLIQVNREEGTIFLPLAGMKLDMGGIAKGYATDKAVEVLQKRGIKSALVNAGGNVRIIGKRPDGKPWRIGVQNPRKEDGIAAKLALDNWNTMETSGDYQRFIMKDGIRYSHLLDPRTGKQPRGTISVTMVLNNSTDGDVFSTALFVLGAEKGLQALQKFPGVEAIFIDETGKISYSPGLNGKIEVE